MTGSAAVQLADRPASRVAAAPRALSWAAAATALVWIGPYFAWGSPNYFWAAITFLVGVFVVTSGSAQLSRRNVLLAAVFLLFMMYLAAHPPGGLLAPSTGWMALLVFVVLPDDRKADSYRALAVLFALSLLPGIAVWLLSAAGVDVPWTYLYARRLDADLLVTGAPSYYREYLGSVVRSFGIFTLGSGATLFRLHGMYEEPGVVGTVAGLLLVAGRFRLRGRPENVVLLVGGLMSLSLAFYALAYGYALVRRPAVVLGLTAAAAALFVALDLGERLPVLQALILDRLAPGSTSLIGENRTSPLFLSLYREFWRADLPTRLFGSPRDIRTVVDTGTFSYQVVVFQYGVLGFGGLLALLATGTLATSRGRDAVILLGALFASVYQRPNVFSLQFLIILFGGAAALEASRRAAGRRGAASPAAAPSP